jgi:sirohydrochlorin cobaltochelatase
MRAHDLAACGYFEPLRDCFSRFDAFGTTHINLFYTMDGQYRMRPRGTQGVFLCAPRRPHDPLTPARLTLSDDFSDAALLVIGHGSTLNADSAAPTYQHVDELRRRNLFAQVQEAFWKQEPYVAQVLRGLFAPRVFIVPLFISQGYFTEEVLPRELGLCRPGETDFPRTQKRSGQTLFYAGPVGTHPSMTAVLLARAGGIVKQFPFPRAPKPAETALFIAGHGTGNNENSRQAIEDQAELIRARQIYSEVHAVFMEEDPRVADCYKLARSKNIVMVPFFISDGLHSHEDIPVMLGAPKAAVAERLQQGLPTWRNPTERHGKRLWYSASVGNEPHLADVILERARDAAKA